MANLIGGHAPEGILSEGLLFEWLPFGTGVSDLVSLSGDQKAHTALPTLNATQETPEKETYEGHEAL
uniref:Uncharacterized protein n=1 Tax=Coccidioides posadasii RMSCC 3488 TaxID=454284 RepID=A0A0J6FA30_COCPO|nr:hypothetical protein CPAG_06219 [Coccidioides posadasii RMSCC 3488]